ncbi:unnamed protein product [Rhodiola kirilowii]
MKSSPCLRQWLLCITVMFAFIFFFDEVRGECLERHKSLLLNFKHSLVIDEYFFLNKPSKLANWNSSTDCCLWPGVTCSGMHVTGLDLSNEGIVGGFNDSSPLFDLTSLTNLTMMDQRPIIPSGIGRLKNLMTLNISNSGFSPKEVSNLTGLVSPDLTSYGYHLKAENPNLRMLVGNLSNLIYLRLDNVNLSSQSREWCQVLSSSTPRLQVLNLRNCGLSGPIHDSLQNLTHLSIVDLSVNDFSGPIPYGVFASLENLTSLTLSHNEFSGVFPHRMLQFPPLRFLDMSWNDNLEASPSIIFRNNSLETLRLHGTRFSKTVPESIGEAKMLSHLDLSCCILFGQIPKSISQLEHLVYLDLSFNNLDGHIPSFSRSRNLTHLDLSYNLLHGSVLATDWKQLPQMETLLLQSNEISGSIPACWFEIPSLEILDLEEGNHFTGFTNETDVKASLSNLKKLSLRGNDLQGPIPPFIYGLSSLRLLDLSFNNITEMFLEEFPPFLSNKSTLGSLALSDKQIDGHIEGQIWNMSALTDLDLSNNQISGHIPDQIWNMSALTDLDLSNNQISGHIPDQIWNMSALTYLNLSHNQLEFLAMEEHSVRLAILDLSSNKLHGSIPESICNMTGLFILDLSNNFLSGTLPQCWPPYLFVLNLSKNNISGIIPDTLPLFLQILDLSQNSFHGKILKSLEGCTYLEVLNLGHNQLHDMFPCWINNLDQLSVLVLRSNSLYGSIQCLNHNFNLSSLQIMDIASNNFVGNLPSQGLLSWEAMMVEKRSTYQTGGPQYLQLHINQGIFTVTVSVTVKGLKLDSIKISTIYTLVDFSDNKFEGEIPHEFGKLKLLYALNLSHNYLSGQIPPSFGNLSGVESLDMSKNELSGKIPEQLASLSSLSYLNLSFNHLEGKIPEGSQFNTFTEDSFKENKGLCGQPLNLSCGNEGVNRPPNPSYEAEDELGDDFKFRDIFIATEIGYAFGFGLVIMPLFFWSTWRKRYYKCIDKVLNGIC